MSDTKSMDKFLDAFNSNAGGVLSTITNQEINFTTKKFGDFALADVEA